LEVNGDQPIEESSNSDMPAADAGLTDAASIPADPVIHPEKPVAETKKKTRGRKRKQPASKSKTEQEVIHAVSPESAAVHQPEKQDKIEIERDPEPQPKLEPEETQVEASAEPAEKQSEKKKRRPGRPRKKNGSSKPSESPNVKEGSEATAQDGTKLPEAE